MFFAHEFQSSIVYILPHTQGLGPSKHMIHVCKIALHGKHDKHIAFCIAKAPPHRQFGLIHEQSVLIEICIG